MAGVGQILANIRTRCPHCAASLKPDEVVNEFFRQVIETLKRGERVQITGVGTFNPSEVAARRVQKPPPRRGAGRSKKASKEFMDVPARKVVRFSSSQALKAALNGEALPPPRQDRAPKGKRAQNKPVVARRTGLSKGA
jgi:nucleoid DNA-binding protein